MNVEDAEKHPAGQGRNEPDPLEKPKWVQFLKTLDLDKPELIRIQSW